MGPFPRSDSRCWELQPWITVSEAAWGGFAGIFLSVRALLDSEFLSLPTSDPALHHPKLERKTIKLIHPPWTSLIVLSGCSRKSGIFLL